MYMYINVELCFRYTYYNNTTQIFDATTIIIIIIIIIILRMIKFIKINVDLVILYYCF